MNNAMSYEEYMNAYKKEFSNEVPSCENKKHEEPRITVAAVEKEIADLLVESLDDLRILYSSMFGTRTEPEIPIVRDTMYNSLITDKFIATEIRSITTELLRNLS